MKRIVAFKSVMWFLVGTAAMIAVFRFWKGLGATTALTDLTPWGFWIGFDVMGGVALAAGGFVVAATVYVFHLDRYHSIVRPAVLTAFLGYIAVVGGLLFDVGLPWSLWHMMIYWNPHSPLFEVGWCVMLYSTVLMLEFAPVVLEMARHPFLAKVHDFLKKFTVPLVILGIMLSTLHQSSLGSLFLIMPHRVHALWYTPILPILFFTSAIGLGTMMVTVESAVSAWLYEQEPETPLLTGLGKAAAGVLWFYMALKLGDLAVRGELAGIFAGTFEANLFLLEIMASALIPATMFSIPSIRNRHGGVVAAAGIGVCGIILNRLNVGGVAMIGTTGTRYIPAWTEVAVSFGVVAAAALVYLFVAERFNLFHAGAMHRNRAKYTKAEFDPATLTVMPDPYWGGMIKYSAYFVGGAAIALALLPERAFSDEPVSLEPVSASSYGELMIIDGNRTDEAVLFAHQDHVDREGGDESCASCHHMVQSGGQATSCASCHSDMWVASSIFDHDIHSERLEAGEGCDACHINPDAPKTMEYTKPCLECHTGMVAPGSTIEIKDAPRVGSAMGYANAFHTLCVDCHETRAEDPELNRPDLGQCASCHTGEISELDPMHPDTRLPPDSTGSETRP